MTRRAGMSVLLAALMAGSLAGRAAAEDHPPIPVMFELGEPAFVTLVIEDTDGVRVRNLVSETPFPAGRNTVWWDGLDDLGSDPDAAAHGVYHVPGKLVEPGKYVVRGLVRKDVNLRYEFCVYNPGKPPWRTADTSSEWLTNHTPPGAVCFVPEGAAPSRGDAGSPPQVLIGSFVAEGGSGLAWVDLDGNKLHGQMWVGGVWTGAQFIARDAGKAPAPGVYAYVASAWKGDKYNDNQAEIRLHKLVNDEQKLAAPRDQRFGHGEDPPVLKPTWKFPSADVADLGGLAVRDGLVVLSLPKMNALLIVDAIESTVLGTLPLEAPQGVAFTEEGRLLAVSGTNVIAMPVPPRDHWKNADIDIAAPTPVVTEGLLAPQQIAVGADGTIYVSDWGASHQVKAFTSAGKFLHAIGTPGVPKAGPYDETHMHRPKGITLDSRGNLWVAEEDYQPKRVSVWTAKGEFLRAFYGPPRYGGGGTLDPVDKTLFYLRGMTFKLDWETGESKLIAIRWRPQPDDFALPTGHHADGPPDRAIYHHRQKYFTNCFDSHPTNGTGVTCIWQERDGAAVPVAAFGDARYWKWLAEEPQRSKIPFAEKPEPDKQLAQGKFMFVWSDLNGDGAGQPGEVQAASSVVGTGVLVGPDLSLVTGDAVRFSPVRFTDAGAPVYDLARGEVLCPGTQRRASTGGGQVLVGEGDWVVLTTAPEPFTNYAIGGAKEGVARWSYPSPWPGLHASHIAPVPEFPGQLIGTTRLLGPAFKLHDDLELWALNGNKGSIYLFTTDGLFVATLFQDARTPHSAWSERPEAVRGMSVSDLTNGEESFWPSITCITDGKVYVVTRYPAIIEVEGLDTLRRITPPAIEVTPAMLKAAQTYHVAAELNRQAAAEKKSTLIVPILAEAPAVDGDLGEWAPERFVTIDVRKKQVGNWGRRDLPTQAALAVSGNRLYGAFRTGNRDALENAGTSLQNLFKTGGGLDLMLGTDAAADPNRRRAAAGDVRLLISKVKQQIVAVLYRAVAPGAEGEPVPFSSPLRTIYFDEVRDVSETVVFAGGVPSKDPTVVPDPGGDFEFSIPLSVLGLEPKPGMTIRGDVGVLRGSRIETTQRAYWTNKATGLVSDVPSEAELIPCLWGTIQFVAP